MKNRQGLTIAALIVAIVGLSIGFAAFSNTLTISSSASVNPSDENFIVQFSKVSDADQTGSSYQIVPSSETYGDRATINSSNKKLLEGVHAKFTAPGQSVTYTLYVRNTGAYVAYLKELAFANATNATGSETYKHCYAATEDSNSQPIPTAQQATPLLVTQACNGIGISVTIGTAGPITPESASKSLGNQALSANGGYVQAQITISYANNASYVDGPMEVEFGNISFTASSNEGSNQGGSEPTPSEPDTPASNTVTLTSAQIGSGQYIEGFGFMVNVTDTWPSETIQKLANNSSVNSGNGYSYFNNIVCSNSDLTNISNQEIDDIYMKDETNDNFYQVNFAQEDGQTALVVIIKKNGALMTNENYTSDTFKDITFTITGSDS